MPRPHPYWPLFDLTVRTPRLELRLPTDEELVELAAAAARGVHDPDFMPFKIPWTDAESPEQERRHLQFQWRQRAEWTAEEWHYVAAVFVDGRPVGSQGATAKKFAVMRTAATGSWLAKEHQGKGYGKEMRAAMLHLLFAGLGAHIAYSGAFHDNGASLGVSRALGYEENGDAIALRREQPSRQIKLKLTRERWEQRRRDDIEIVGLEPCLELFGAH